MHQLRITAACSLVWVGVERETAALHEAMPVVKPCLTPALARRGPPALAFLHVDSWSG